MNCCTTSGGLFDQASETVLECDYDKNVTNLYRNIETKAWSSVECFFETGKWAYIHFTKDALSPSEQARTWVTRFESNGKVRWSQLPLHAAIIFGAPKGIVEFLIELYPLSARCTDDQGMLPLHLAFRAGSNDGIMNLLIKGFPEALVTQNQRGLLPYDMDGRDTRKDYNECVQEIVKHVTRSVMMSQERVSKEKTDTLEGSMGVQDRLVKTLEKNNDILENQLSEAKEELRALRDRCRLLEKMIAARKLPAATTQSRNSKPAKTGGFRRSKARNANANANANDADTGASTVSSVHLNSVRRPKGSNEGSRSNRSRQAAAIDDAGIELKLKESEEGLFMNIVPKDSKEVETRADEETSSRGRNLRHRNPSARKRSTSKKRTDSNSKLMMMNWCEGSPNDGFLI